MKMKLFHFMLKSNLLSSSYPFYVLITKCPPVSWQNIVGCISQNQLIYSSISFVYAFYAKIQPFITQYSGSTFFRYSLDLRDLSSKLILNSIFRTDIQLNIRSKEMVA